MDKLKNGWMICQMTNGWMICQMTNDEWYVKWQMMNDMSNDKWWIANEMKEWKNVRIEKLKNEI